MNRIPSPNSWYAEPDLVTPQRIPKTVWQTIGRNVVPSGIRDWANTWIKLNPEYDYNLVDDDGMRGFVRSSFPEYLQAFDKTVHGASKAGLWRYLLMFKYGEGVCRHRLLLPQSSQGVDRS